MLLSQKYSGAPKALFVSIENEFWGPSILRYFLMIPSTLALLDLRAGNAAFDVE
jgi:hypothetical protein